MTLVFMFSNQYVDARCPVNTDWPSAPCYDEIPYTTNNDKSIWEKYYDYKGIEFMESKRKDMLDALRTGKLCEWVEDGQPFQNHNVLRYYYVNKVISSNDCSTATEFRYSGNFEIQNLDDEIKPTPQVLPSRESTLTIHEAGHYIPYVLIASTTIIPIIIILRKK